MSETSRPRAAFFMSSQRKGREMFGKAAMKSRLEAIESELIALQTLTQRANYAAEAAGPAVANLERVTAEMVVKLRRIERWGDTDGRKMAALEMACNTASRGQSAEAILDRAGVYLHFLESEAAA